MASPYLRIRIPSDLHLALRVQAAHVDLNAGRLSRAFVTAWLAARVDVAPVPEGIAHVRVPLSQTAQREVRIEAARRGVAVSALVAGVLRGALAAVSVNP